MCHREVAGLLRDGLAGNGGKSVTGLPSLNLLIKALTGLLDESKFFLFSSSSADFRVTLLMVVSGVGDMSLAVSASNMFFLLKASSPR